MTSPYCRVSRHMQACARLARDALFLVLFLAGTAPAHAGTLIDRTITVDGAFTDWTGTGGTYNPPGNILTNTDQYGTDCQSATACEADNPLTSTGRDLKKFAFTWDTTKLYFYIERWDSGSNVTDWWFYMDVGGDGRMNAGEKVMRVNWKGSNRTTIVSVWNYTPVNPAGDPMTSGGTADGYDMPGAISGETALYTALGGSNTGFEMESYLTWAALGVGGPTNMNFHVSSSNGTSLPGNLIDNVQGPSANQLFPSDIRVQKTASVASISANWPFTYTVTVTNTGYQTFTGVAISDVIPANVAYVSYTTTAGSYIDTNANGVPDRWNIGTLTAQQSVTLTINVQAGNVTAPVVTTNTAALAAYGGAANFFLTNDVASANVTISPSPLLSVTKLASTGTATTGTIVTYRILVSNVGYAIAKSVSAVDTLSPFSAFRVAPGGNHVVFTDDTVLPSGLTLGTPTYYDKNNAVITPTSGGGSAPSGFDARVHHFTVPLNGIMNGNGGNFWLVYDVIVL